MSIKKMMAFVGLCTILTGCQTGGLDGNSRFASLTESNADKGARYLLGRGVPQSDSKAFYYFSRAAAEDDPFGENEMAYLYASGKGTPRNSQKAFEYYFQAAEHGLASAQYNLGLFYYYGVGTTQNKALAIKWWQKAAATGFEPAKAALAKYS